MKPANEWLSEWINEQTKHSYSQWIEIDEIGTCKRFMSRHLQHVY